LQDALKEIWTALQNPQNTSLTKTLKDVWPTLEGVVGDKTLEEILATLSVMGNGDYKALEKALHISVLGESNAEEQAMMASTMAATTPMVATTPAETTPAATTPAVTPPPATAPPVTTPQATPPPTMPYTKQETKDEKALEKALADAIGYDDTKSDKADEKALKKAMGDKTKTPTAAGPTAKKTVDVGSPAKQSLQPPPPKHVDVKGSIHVPGDADKVPVKGTVKVFPPVIPPAVKKAETKAETQNEIAALGKVMADYNDLVDKMTGAVANSESVRTDEKKLEDDITGVRVVSAAGKAQVEDMVANVLGAAYQAETYRKDLEAKAKADYDDLTKKLANSLNNADAASTDEEKLEKDVGKVSSGGQISVKAAEKKAENEAEDEMAEALGA
jgi:hypothetical protein